MKLTTAQKMLFEAGLSPRHKGFHYLSAALCRAATAGAGAVRGAMAQDDGHINRCMRYAIRYAWDGNEGDIRSLFRNHSFPPTPLELIHALLWKLDSEAGGEERFLRTGS